MAVMDKLRHRQSKRIAQIAAVLFLLLLPILFLSTLARSLVLGDPTEYTFIANILGIAHPPGYAFITLVGHLFQRFIPIGDPIWRMHLLAAVAAILACLFALGIVRAIACHLPPATCDLPLFSGVLAALLVGTAVNIWQHAIHANPHIVTGTFLMANLYFLTRWWAETDGGRWTVDDKAAGNVAKRPLRVRLSVIDRRDKWLYAFCLSAGLGVTHHPLTVFGFPAYALFIVWTMVGTQSYTEEAQRGSEKKEKDKISFSLRISALTQRISAFLFSEWRTMLVMVGFALLGLSVWLYFPLRSPTTPFGPTTMNTLDGFLAHVLARGLSDSLPYYSLVELPHRALVFWTLLRLQYGLPFIILAGVGLYKLWATARLRPIGLLYTLALAANYAFTMSLRQQDIMAYLLGPFMLIGMLAGLGLVVLLNWLHQKLKKSVLICVHPSVTLRTSLRPVIVGLTLLLAFLLGPLAQINRSLPHISLRHYSEGSDFVTAVFSYFPPDANATLLTNWEHMTPLWYTRYVDDRWPDPASVRPEFISTGGENPWLEAVFIHLPGGPVYLHDYRSAILAGTEFRLRPRGPFYQVAEPHNADLPEELTVIPPVGGGDLVLLAYDLPQREVTAGDFVPLTLAMQAPSETAEFYVPVLTVGEIVFEFTTDSHLITPLWYGDEIIIERFDFALPHDLPSGRYPVQIDFKNLSQDQLLPLDQSLGELHVTAQENPPATGHLLANFRQRVGLVGATAWHGLRRQVAPWEHPIHARPGDVIHLVFEWESLALAEESYTIFVHLNDMGHVPHVSLDYTPLGGATPTHLWFPKWLPGQRMLDPYRLEIPADLAPGHYYIEVGLYEMVGLRRLHISDQQGNLNGDRFILGTVIVE
jgi:hypothetical protein